MCARARARERERERERERQTATPIIYDFCKEEGENGYCRKAVFTTPYLEFGYFPAISRKPLTVLEEPERTGSSSEGMGLGEQSESGRSPAKQRERDGSTG